MAKFCCWVLAFGFSCSAFGFYSDRATEAWVRVEHEVVLRDEPNSPYIPHELEEIMLYTAGPLAKGQELGAWGAVGRKHDGRISILSQSYDPAVNQTRIRFAYEGTFLVGSGHGPVIEFYFPINRRSIYEDSQLPGKTGRDRHPCLGAYYHDWKYFWYFWDPRRSGCPLKENVHYTVTKASYRRLPNTTVTYPQYERLFASGEMTAFVAFGADIDKNGLKSPHDTDDNNSGNYIRVAHYLRRKGFASRKWTSADFIRTCGSDESHQSWVEEFTNTISGRKLRILLMWGVTSVGPETRPFHCLFDRALAKDSVFIYNGHSGLGSGLFLESLRALSGLPFRPNKDKYQIYGLVGCSSYGYYNRDFFVEKSTAHDPRGVKNLEVLTTGVAGNFKDMDHLTTNLFDVILDYAHHGKRTSYQTLIRNFNVPYMAAVNGDE